MRLVFAGTPQAAVPSLERLGHGEHEITSVVTRTDAYTGRQRVLTQSPVASAAKSLGIPVLKANRLDDEISARIAELAPDLGVIVAYGGLVREPLLSTPRLGWINLHFSLLPRWRGAAPVQHAVMAGDETTGAVVFQLVAELDAGSIFGTVTRPIGPDETSGDLLSALAISGADLLSDVVSGLAEGTARAIEQVGQVTLAPKLSIDDAHIDFGTSAISAYSRIRAVTPEPGPFCFVGDLRIKILGARIAGDVPAVPVRTLVWDGRRLVVGTLSEPIELIALQPAGKRPMAAADWWRGLAVRDGLTVA